MEGRRWPADAPQGGATRPCKSPAGPFRPSGRVALLFSQGLKLGGEEKRDPAGCPKGGNDGSNLQRGLAGGSRRGRARRGRRGRATVGTGWFEGPGPAAVAAGALGRGPAALGLGAVRGSARNLAAGCNRWARPGGRARGGRARDQLLQGAEDSLAGAAGNFDGLIAGNLKRLDIKKEVGDKSDQLGKNPHILLGEDESQLNSYRQIGERRLSRPLEAAV